MLTMEGERETSRRERDAAARGHETTDREHDVAARERRTGQLTSTVLVAARHEGQLYLVSMLGNSSEWVQNVRAANGFARVKRWSVTPIRLTEIPTEQRAPILKAWCRVATSGRKHLPVAPDAPVQAFEAIAADYPVFRMDLA